MSRLVSALSTTPPPLLKPAGECAEQASGFRQATRCQELPSPLADVEKVQGENMTQALTATGGMPAYESVNTCTVRT